MTPPSATTFRRNLAVLATVICALLAVIFPMSSTGAATRPSMKGDGASTAGTGSDSGSASPSRKTRDANRQVDALTATREQVARKVRSLDSQYQAQQAAVAAAEAEVVTAKQKVASAKARVALAENEVELAEISVKQYAVEAYIRPPAETSMRVLSLKKAEAATYVSDVLKIVTEERHKVVDALAVKKKIASMESDLADKTAAEAADKASAAHAALGELDGIREDQSELAASLDARLARAQSEAASREANDKQVAEELAAQELELRKSAGLPTASLVSDTKPRSSPPVSSAAVPVTNPPTTTRPKSPTTTRPKSPTTTVPPTPPGLVGWDDVTKVGSFWVHKSIASNVRGLLDAATSAGFSLSGGGYRDSASQIATRRANCGTTYYDIYVKPSGQCTPPTAIPGRSMHEQGKALDIQSSGSLITSRSNPAFIWLSKNAARFGLYNLPSEPWHWSTNGR
ncbi:MAG: D-alanyl-D-alanine carboxypeptidase family protein [Microthrixaceae bacterium]